MISFITTPYSSLVNVGHQTNCPPKTLPTIALHTQQAPPQHLATLHIPCYSPPGTPCTSPSPTQATLPLRQKQKLDTNPILKPQHTHFHHLDLSSLNPKKKTKCLKRRSRLPRLPHIGLPNPVNISPIHPASQLTPSNPPSETHMHVHSKSHNNIL